MSHQGECMICKRYPVEIENLPIYVIGSEGLNVCHSCKMILTEYVKYLISTVSRVTMDIRKRSK
jgi:hypothetical protein